VLHETRGLKAEIKKICIKNPGKSRPIDQRYFTTSKEEILNDPEIDVVVELIDDAQAAFAILKEALQKGKAVVTANKKMLAENLEEVFQLQKKYNKAVLYEGAVCGSIPIIRNLEEYYDNDLLTGIEGIFNGSTNYILTKVVEERKSYEEALKKAQELGFAESDPTLDVKGFDPKFKLTIVIAHTFGVFESPENIVAIGIDKLSSIDLKFAKEKGFQIKLVARAHKINGKIHAIVAPQFVPEHHPLASVRNEYNAVLVESAFSEKQTFIGKGAGSYPTGSAVLSDISALTYNYAYEYKKRLQNGHVAFSNDASLDVQVSFTNPESVQISDFEEFRGGFNGNGHQFMRGLAKVSQLRKWSSLEDVSIVLNEGNPFLPKEGANKEVLSLAG
jgi:homoserine dehydrogenase